MTDSPVSIASSWIGPIIGLGFGLYTLKMLQGLPYTARRDIDVLLSKSKRVNNQWVVNVKNINLNRVRRLLKMSGFKIVDEHMVVKGIHQIKFEELKA